MSTTYVRPKFTDGEARALLKVGRQILDDEDLTAEIFTNGIESSAGWQAVRKLAEAIANEKPAKKAKK